MAKAASLTRIKLTAGCGRVGARGPEGAVIDCDPTLAALLVKHGSAVETDEDATLDPPQDQGGDTRDEAPKPAAPAAS